jgi:hypothetical protein
VPNVTFDVEVFCAACGAGLCQQTDVTRKRGADAFYVAPCETCLDAAKEKGYDSGYDKARGEFEQ